MKKLQNQLDSLARAYREQKRDTQQLQQVYQALKTENDKLRREKRALQLEIHSKNNDLLKENRILRDENENATRAKRVVRSPMASWWTRSSASPTGPAARPAGCWSASKMTGG